MKKLILMTAFCFSFISLSHAQVGLALDNEHLETSQPGVILITTPKTSFRTFIHFNQVFKCLNYGKYSCLEYAENETLKHDVELRFLNTPVASDDFYSFHVEYDLTQEKFLISIYSRTNEEAKYAIQTTDTRSVITIDN
jgi:hypothetical protein